MGNATYLEYTKKRERDLDNGKTTYYFEAGVLVLVGVDVQVSMGDVSMAKLISAADFLLSIFEITMISYHGVYTRSALQITKLILIIIFNYNWF